MKAKKRPKNLLRNNSYNTCYYEIYRIHLVGIKLSTMISKPTESELEILSILWKLKKASVRAIHEQISETKETGYTTTLKLLQIMLAKGLVKRDEKNRSHIYTAALTEKDTQKSLLKGFMSAAFGGSAKNLVMQALGQGNPSQEEINEIREFLDQLEKEN